MRRDVTTTRNIWWGEAPERREQVRKGIRFLRSHEAPYRYARRAGPSVRSSPSNTTTRDRIWPSVYPPS